MRTGSARVFKILGLASVLLFVISLATGPVLAASSARVLFFASFSSCWHPEMPGSNAVTATVFRLEVTEEDGSVQLYWAYCANLGVDFCGKGLSNQENVSDPKVVWILHNYDPDVYEVPAGLTAGEQAAAVQLAIWYYTSYFNFMDDAAGTPENVFAAARTIVAAAEASGWDSLPVAPATLDLSPVSATNAVGTAHQVTATVLDEAGNPMAGIPVEFTVSGANSAGPQQISTGADGTAVFSYNGANAGTDQISATVNYVVPVGWTWGKDGCQGLIAAGDDPVYLSANASKTWEDRVGGQGCTPGYWKQKQHFDSWVGYTPDGSYFDEVFGVGPHITLLKALGTGGGGEKALLRHATAALLNTAKLGKYYYYTTDEVISMVQQAYATGNFERVKNQFEIQNEAGCPLD